MRYFSLSTWSLAGLIALGNVVPSTVLAQEASVHCSTLSNLRQNYTAMNKTIAKERGRAMTEQRQENPFDAASTGCFGDWGTNLGLGLPGLADAFFDQLADQACSAMNDYVNSQLDALSSSVSAPLDLVGVDFEFGGDAPFSVNTEQRDIDLDTGAIVDDVMSRAPDTGIEGINRDGQGIGGRDLDDIYLNQGRGQSVPTPNWNPSAGGRTQ